MVQDIKNMTVEFDNSAAKIYSGIFEQFLSSVKKIKRKTNENVFRMQIAKFSHELRGQLEQEAKRISENYSGKLQEQLEISLTKKINYYLQEFLHKCDAW
jgi:hypothetical protein